MPQDILDQIARLRVQASIGRWLIAKARRQAAESGVQQAARNLRKQGLPVELAVQILARNV